MTTKTCPNSSSCEMFTLLRLAGSLATWKINYCDSNYSRCARYERTCSGLSVPVNLMPNGALLRRPTSESATMPAAVVSATVGKKAP